MLETGTAGYPAQPHSNAGLPPGFDEFDLDIRLDAAAKGGEDKPEGAEIFPSDGPCKTSATCVTCRTCNTQCNEATCDTCNTKCNQHTCAATCETCNTQCKQETCNTCQTQCQQNTCGGKGAKTCVTCDTCIECTRPATCAGPKCPG